MKIYEILIKYRHEMGLVIYTNCNLWIVGKKFE